MKKRKIYISGPMTGLDREEYMKRFLLAEDRLHQIGYKRICNPINVWACRWPKLYKLIEWLFGTKGAYNLVLLYDLWLLMRCTDICMLRGYDQSKGSCIERYVATKMGINILKNVGV